MTRLGSALLLLLLIACLPSKPDPVDDTGATDASDAPDDTAPPDTADTADTGAETGDDSGDTAPPDTGDTGTPLTWGDNLAELGRYEPFSNMEALGLVAWGDGRMVLCAGVARPTTFDVTGDAPVKVAEFGFPDPATGPRCQHLDVTDDHRVVVTHHGDEMGAGWVGLADVTDLALPLGLEAWAAAGVAPEGVDVDGDVAWVAAHEAGLLRFDLSGGALGEPATVATGFGNAYAVRARGERVAVGLVEGGVVVLDRGGVEQGRLATSGPVRDLEWADDDTLLAACGSAGVDRLDVATGLATAHADGPGTALDLAVLDDGSVLVAGYTLLAVYDRDLELRATEEFADEDVAMLAVATDRGGAYAGEWQTVLSYAWDPTLGAPDLRLDRDSVDFPNADAGEEVAFALVLRNDGPFDLSITEVATADGVTVDRSALTIPAGGADFVELRWVSDGLELRSTLNITSDDPDEGVRVLDVTANLQRAGVGDPLPPFRYVTWDGAQTFDSTDLGGPALLSYFATF